MLSMFVTGKNEQEPKWKRWAKQLNMDDLKKINPNGKKQVRIICTVWYHSNWAQNKPYWKYTYIILTYNINTYKNIICAICICNSNTLLKLKNIKELQTKNSN